MTVNPTIPTAWRSVQRKISDFVSTMSVRSAANSALSTALSTALSSGVADTSSALVASSGVSASASPSTMAPSSPHAHFCRRRTNFSALLRKR